MFWWVFDLFFCIKGATASGDQKWTWPMLKLLYNRESSLVLSVPRGVGWRGGVRLKREKMWKWKLLNLVQLFVTSWTIAHHAPLSMEFSRQEYWSGLLFPSPGDLSDPGIEPGSPSFQADSLPTERPGKTLSERSQTQNTIYFILYFIIVHINCPELLNL